MTIRRAGATRALRTLASFHTPHRRLSLRATLMFHTGQTLSTVYQDRYLIYISPSFMMYVKVRSPKLFELLTQPIALCGSP